jgi:hypothetical protein
MEGWMIEGHERQVNPSNSSSPHSHFFGGRDNLAVFIEN